MKNSDKKVSISIVNYNAGDYLIKCLKSLEKIKDELPFEVFVVDNASSDDSIEKAKNLFPQHTYILNNENLGFGKAHNQVLRINKNKYVLVLNPDVELEKGVLKDGVEYLDKHLDVGAVTGEILLPSGKKDLVAHRGFPTPWASFKYYFFKDDSLYHLTNRDFSKPHEVDAISGAFFLTRKSVLDKVGYFDEDYFMYAEDIDLCYRIKLAGYKIIYLPHLKILHYKGVSTGIKKHSRELTTASLETKKRSVNEFYKTMKIFYRKHLDQKYPFFINWLVYTGINFRWWLAKNKLNV